MDENLNAWEKALGLQETVKTLDRITDVPEAEVKEVVELRKQAEALDVMVTRDVD